MKRSYKIGEVCKQLDIQPYVLRYWETEFAALHPRKSQSGQRAYSESEIGVIRRIKRLLYEEGYTIAGAKKKLESEPGVGDGPLFVERAEASTGDRGGEAPTSLDSPAGDRIESLQRGVAEALEEARGILALLAARRR